MMFVVVVVRERKLSNGKRIIHAELNPAQPIVDLNTNIDSYMSRLLSLIAPEFLSAPPPILPGVSVQ